MKGAMQDWPLLIPRLIEHADIAHGGREIVSFDSDGAPVRTNWRGLHARAQRLAKALVRLGVRPGDRVATIAWNTTRHLEAWFAVAGIGAVMHTINPRLGARTVAWIAADAGDVAMLFDSGFASLAAEIAPDLPNVRHWVALTDRAALPDIGVPGAIAVEDLIAAEADGFAWPRFDERTPYGLCYTSGTTGNPKGVLYDHRSTVLHTMMTAQPDVFALGAESVVYPIVPMCHANAWCLPFVAASVGAKLVLGGPHTDAPTIVRLIRDEGATFTGGVPTVWLGVLDLAEADGQGLGCLKRAVIGGSAAPPSMIRRFAKLGVEVVHGWGMTELSPLGTANCPVPELARLCEADRLAHVRKAGRPPFGVELRLVDDKGQVLPRDGRAAGRLLVRGASVIDSYFGREPGSALDADGYFDTGDIATIDDLGYITIVDRAKDLVKSGGEWISSIDLENLSVAHPTVSEAAVIPIPDLKWQERPLLLLVPRSGAKVDPAEIRDFLGGQVPKWWIPDQILVLDAFPHTATGKINKMELRERYGGVRYDRGAEPAPAP